MLLEPRDRPAHTFLTIGADINGVLYEAAPQVLNEVKHLGCGVILWRPELLFCLKLFRVSVHPPYPATNCNRIYYMPIDNFLITTRRHVPLSGMLSHYTRYMLRTHTRPTATPFPKRNTRFGVMSGHHNPGDLFNHHVHTHKQQLLVP